MDQKNERVMVYIFEKEDDSVVYLYTFSDEIPVHIFGGELVIDMKEVKQAVEDFYN